VDTQSGPQCAYPCSASAFCEDAHTCSIASDGEQVCWGGDTKLAGLDDFVLGYVMQVDGIPVSSVSIAQGRSAYLEISATNTSREIAAGLWATSIKFPSSISLVTLNWNQPSDNGGCDTSYRPATGDYDCRAVAAIVRGNGGGNWTLEPGVRKGPFLSLGFHLKVGTQPQQLPISLRFGADTGQTADLQFTISVVP
jgi:hypothetical protein